MFFYRFVELSAIFIKFEIVICKLFEFEEFRIFRFWDFREWVKLLLAAKEFIYVILRVKPELSKTELSFELGHKSLYL